MGPAARRRPRGGLPERADGERAGDGALHAHLNAVEANAHAGDHARSLDEDDHHVHVDEGHQNPEA